MIIASLRVENAYFFFTSAGQPSISLAVGVALHAHLQRQATEKVIDAVIPPLEVFIPSNHEDIQHSKACIQWNPSIPCNTLE